MHVVKGAVGGTVAALLAGHQLSTMDASRWPALWNPIRSTVGLQAPPTVARPVPAAAPVVAMAATGVGDESIAADLFGQYLTEVEIDGERLPVLVDTGATFVALTAEDADRIGIRPLPSDFRYAVDTANGRATVAQVRLASVRLGGIELRDVAALVSGRGQLGRTLLGMSFLSRLSGLRIDRGRLILSR